MFTKRKYYHWPVPTCALQPIAYPGVVHSFTSKEADANGEKFDMPLAYEADADAKSWASLMDLLGEVF